MPEKESTLQTISLSPQGVNQRSAITASNGDLAFSKGVAPIEGATARVYGKATKGKFADPILTMWQMDRTNAIIQSFANVYIIPISEL